MNALGMYPGNAGPLGGECTGTIVSVRLPASSRLQIGDRVIAVGPGCHDGYVCVRQELAIHRPANFTLTDAAGFAIPFLTASYTLEHLAKLQRGERVLIHAATGGVGLAAVQIAQHAGAEIFATAGTAEKRQHLRSLGIRHVFNSRSTDFAAAILQITDGTGVNVVLNSLAGGQLDSSFDTIGAGGRFLRLGRTPSGLSSASDLLERGLSTTSWTGVWSPMRIRLSSATCLRA